jgi:hypothetical protein
MHRVHPFHSKGEAAVDGLLFSLPMIVRVVMVVVVVVVVCVCVCVCVFGGGRA